jgi:hypothetical protein
MNKPMYPLNKEVSGFLQEEWVCSGTAPFPAYFGHACFLRLKGTANPVIVMGSTSAEVFATCQKLDPAVELVEVYIRPVVITHQQNVELIDSEL